MCVQGPKGAQGSPGLPGIPGPSGPQVSGDLSGQTGEALFIVLTAPWCLCRVPEGSEVNQGPEECLAFQDLRLVHHCHGMTR